MVPYVSPLLCSDPDQAASIELLTPPRGGLSERRCEVASLRLALAI